MRSIRTDGRVHRGKKCPYIRLRRGWGSPARIFRESSPERIAVPVRYPGGEAEQLFRRHAPSFSGGDRSPDDLRRGSIWSTIKRTARSHPCAASPRLVLRCRAVFLWPRGRDGGINPLGRLLTLGTRRRWLMPAVLFRVNAWTEFIAFESEARMYRILRANVKSEQQANLLNPLRPDLWITSNFIKNCTCEFALIYFSFRECESILVLENVRVEGCIEDWVIFNKISRLN